MFLSEYQIEGKCHRSFINLKGNRKYDVFLKTQILSSTYSHVNQNYFITDINFFLKTINYADSAIAQSVVFLHQGEMCTLEWKCTWRIELNTQSKRREKNCRVFKNR